MPRPLQESIAALDAVASVDDAEELKRLDVAINEIFDSPRPDAAVDALLRLFERFPASDGCGVFWSILHGLESLPGYYEDRLLASVRRAPSQFGLTMLNRMMNAGAADAGGEPILPLMRQCAVDPAIDPEVRKAAAKFVEHQAQKRPPP